MRFAISARVVVAGVLFLSVSHPVVGDQEE